MTHPMDELLDAWFGTPTPDGLPPEDRSTRWFRGGPAFDEELRARFGALHAQALTGALDGWAATPRGGLALLILLDQLSRNLGRGTAAMFAGDDRALALARGMVERGDDRAVGPFERAFVYMPFMHSEALADQERCVALFEALGADTAGPVRARMEYNLGFARAHRDIVARFGRFPHRNAMLGRPSTDEERDFLTQPGSSF